MAVEDNLVGERGAVLSLRWHCEPAEWSVKEGELVIVADANRDFWQRTFYSPLLRKDDAPALLATVDGEATLEVAFTLSPAAQFDQGGALVRIDAETHVKAGIEVVDSMPRLSVVVTNGYSDWSTAPLESTSLRVRVHKLHPGPDQGSAVVVEARSYENDDEPWRLVRVASLRGDSDHQWSMGVFAASPVAQNGSSVTFHSIRLGPKLPTVHDSDPGHESY